jgi:hypothetical protein
MSELNTQRWIVIYRWENSRKDNSDNLAYIQTKNQPTNMFTKPLNSIHKLGVINIHSHLPTWGGVL